MTTQHLQFSHTLNLITIDAFYLSNKIDKSFCFRKFYNTSAKIISRTFNSSEYTIRRLNLLKFRITNIKAAYAGIVQFQLSLIKHEFFYLLSRFHLNGNISRNIGFDFFLSNQNTSSIISDNFS